MNPDCDAPGANDDASGTAVTMELARVLAWVYRVRPSARRVRNANA